MPNHRITPEEYLRKCKEVHGDRYDYSLCEYETSRGVVSIICKDHGVFTTVANTHLSKKSDCPKCVGGIRKTIEEFIEQANKVHQSFYGYSKVVYINKRTKVIIDCPIHGEFTQSPSDHTDGSKCPSCANYGFNSCIPATFYFLSSSSDLVKIGITNRSVVERVKAINKSVSKFGVVFKEEYSKKLSGEQARQYEVKIKGWASSRYEQPNYKFDGYTESFICEDINEFKQKIIGVIDDI